eukprot:gene1888-10443_t
MSRASSQPPTPSQPYMLTVRSPLGACPVKAVMSPPPAPPPPAPAPPPSPLHSAHSPPSTRGGVRNASRVAAVAGGWKTFVALRADGRIAAQWGAMGEPFRVTQRVPSPPVHAVVMTMEAAVALLADGSLMT